MPRPTMIRAAALGSGYMLGICNINLYRQGMLLLAVGQGREDLQGWAALFFALPFVLFSSWTGWLADRFPKKHAALAAKALELAAMAAAAWGILHLHWGLMPAMLFCFGAGVALGGPAVHGGIPELFAAPDVPKVNAVFKLCSTLGILLGVMAAGAALDLAGTDAGVVSRLPLAAAVVLIALAGLAATAFMPFRPAAMSRASRPFPWLGAWDSLRHFRELRADPALRLALAANAFFYFVSGLALLLINALGKSELGFGNTRTSLLPAALSLGLCAGSLLAARRAAPAMRLPRPVPACLGVGLALFAVGPVAGMPEAARFPLLLALHAAMGLCGGLYLIPVASFIQLRPAPEEKGRVLGTDNWLVYSGMLLTGPVYLALERLAPSTAFMVLGLATLLAAAAYARAMRACSR